MLSVTSNPEDGEYRQLFLPPSPPKPSLQDASDSLEPKVETLSHTFRRNCAIPKRYIFSFMGFIACSLAVNFNTNLSIAIVSMVNRNSSLTLVQQSNDCLANSLNENDSSEVEYKAGTFLWTPETEGIAIGAVYYGQLIGFIPGGRLAELYGGKRTLLASIFLSSIFTVLLPLTAYWSVYAFIACRFLIGVGTAPAIPVLFHLIANWIPLTERSVHASVILAGYGVGSFAGFAAAGALCGSDFLGGWPAVFYTGGLAGFMWCIFCYFFVYESPLQHPNISTKELGYILRHLETNKKKQIPKIPWRQMLTSVPLWALSIGYFGQFWILGFFCTAHALYMGTIINLNIVMNGQLSCLPHLLRALFACVCSFPADWLLKKGIAKVGTIRKGATALNTLISCIGFVGILLVGCNPALNTVFFTIGGLLGDFVTFGVCMACIDIAPNLSGTVSGFLNIVGVIPFFLIPAVVGWVTKYERSMAQWRYVYFCTIGVAIVTTLIYLCFGSSQPQPWGVEVHRIDDEETAADKTKREEKDEEAS